LEQSKKKKILEDEVKKEKKRERGLEKGKKRNENISIHFTGERL